MTDLNRIEQLKSLNLICTRCKEQIVSYPYASSRKGDFCLDCHIEEVEDFKALKRIERIKK